MSLPLGELHALARMCECCGVFQSWMVTNVKDILTEEVALGPTLLSSGVSAFLFDRAIVFALLEGRVTVDVFTH